MKRIAISIIAIVLSSCITPTPTPSPQAIAQSKIGLHIVPGRRTWYGTFLQCLSDAGVHPAVVSSCLPVSLPRRPLHRKLSRKAKSACTSCRAGVPGSAHSYNVSPVQMSIPP